MCAKRLELRHPPLRVVVQLGVLDRLAHLAGNRHEQLDLGLVELPLLDGADVQSPLQALPGEDGHGQDGFVLLLVEVREVLEARVEVRGARDHHRRPIGRRRSRDSLAGAHLRRARQLLDARADAGPQHELVRALVVEVDEAGVSLERVRNLRRDQLEQLAEVERRVDRRDRLGDEPEVALRSVHVFDDRHLPVGLGVGYALGMAVRAHDPNVLAATRGYIVADARGRIVGRVDEVAVPADAAPG